MDRIEEIKKRLNEKVYLIDKQELESLKKIVKTTKISDYEVLTDDGFVDIESIHETIPYQVYNLKLEDGKELKCADNHIVFTENMDEIFVKNLKSGDLIMVSDENNKLTKTKVLEVVDLGYQETMYDLELNEDSNRRYYTNGVLSHNTYLAKQLAKQIFGNEDALIRIDMSEFQEKHSISRLGGSPPGYISHDEGGQLTEQVKNKPYSVILFDEVEKAHKDIFSVLLQVLDDGYMTDSLGRKINFKNCVIIMTSNLGVRKLQDFGTGVGFTTSNKSYAQEEQKRDVLKKELQKFFAPEFLNRIDEVIFFNKLVKEDVNKIVRLEFVKLKERIGKIKYFFTFDESLINMISEIGYDEMYGARPLKRAIQDKVEDYISEEILAGRLSENTQYLVSSENNEVKITKIEEEPKKRGRKKKGE